MKSAFIFFTVGVLLFSQPLSTKAQQTANSTNSQSRGLTIDIIVSLVNAGVPADQVVETIQRTPSDFNLTLQRIDDLRNAGIPGVVLDAMVKARKNVAFTNPPNPLPSPSSTPPPPNINPGPANPASVGANN